jgi:hypothetical protein
MMKKELEKIVQSLQEIDRLLISGSYLTPDQKLLYVEDMNFMHFHDRLDLLIKEIREMETP